MERDRHRGSSAAKRQNTCYPSVHSTHQVQRHMDSRLKSTGGQKETEAGITEFVPDSLLHIFPVYQHMCSEMGSADAQDKGILLHHLMLWLSTS